MLIIASWAGVIGCQHCRRIAVTIIQLTKISRARDDVVAGLVGIAAEAIARAKLRPGPGPDLHQTPCSSVRDRGHIAGSFGAHDRPYPPPRAADAAGWRGPERKTVGVGKS